MARKLAHLPHLCFLDSSERGGERGRFSYVMADPNFWGDDGRSGVTSVPFDDLALMSCDVRSRTLEGLPPFQGGHAVMIGYEVCQVLERIPPARFDDLTSPKLAAGVFDWVVSFDHTQKRAWVVSTGFREDDFDPAHAAIRLKQVLEWLSTPLPLDLRLIAGPPAALLAFAEGAGGLAQHWPLLECLVHYGRAIGPAADELRASAGPRLRLHELHATAEGLLAAQDTDAGGGLRLLTDAGIFFEFLPLEEFDEKRLEQLGTRTVPLEGIRPGQDYALVLTTPAGLTRLVNGDIVRFTAKEPARLVRTGALGLQLNAFGERMAEKEPTDALV
ncbi:MAG: GH3 auxin-responsive promoter family protein, partial [Fimbriiglobus sp.]|nr:GH3 auxin-responsive promoter family protein [Fimbriiglobus sp.]